MPEVLTRLEPGLRRVLAPNPSPMTFRGTNTYILGDGDLAVIDPGPNDPAHLAALLDALAPGERIRQILVTHAHRDHSPLARPLSQATGAPVLAFGDATAGRSEIMRDLAARGLSGGEGVDTAFRPDVGLADGERLTLGGLEIEAIWTPGHMANHLCFGWNDRLFTGDHVMGWASSLVSPPDGDLTAFMASCRKLQGGGHRVYYPGHGDPVEQPAARLEWVIRHRLQREAQILEVLASGARTVRQITEAIYTETPPALLPAAERNVLAHLIDLVCRGEVAGPLPPGPDALFRMA